MQIRNSFILALCIIFSNLAIAEIINDAESALRLKNYKLATEKYKQLANNGNTEAFLQLGKMYFEHGNSEELPISEEEAISYLKKATEASKGEAFYILGVIYSLNGKSSKDVFNYYLQGAKLGDAKAQEAVAKAYWDGDGVEKDWKKSFEWNLRGAKNGNSMSVGQVKFAYSHGLVGVVEANDDQVLYWITKSVENGDNTDLYCLASRYESGIGVKKDSKKAIELYSKFKNTEFTYTMDANLAIATIYLDNDGASKNKIQANKFFKLSKIDESLSERKKMLEHYSELNLSATLSCSFERKAEKKFENWLMNKMASLGDPFSQYRLAYSLEDINPTKALALYQEAATKGDELATERMGELYEKGELVQKNDKLSKEWYRKYITIAPNVDLINKAQYFYFRDEIDRALFWIEDYKLKDNPQAQWLLGEIYLRNDRTKYRAIDPLKFAAEKGQDDAQFTLASLYFNGNGVVKSLQNSFNLYKRSAEQGNSFAQLMVAKFYYEGLIESSDKEKAYFWTLLSASNDNSQAKKMIPVIEKEISNSKISDIQSSASTWKSVSEYRFNPSVR